MEIEKYPCLSSCTVLYYEQFLYYNEHIHSVNLSSSWPSVITWYLSCFVVICSMVSRGTRHEKIYFLLAAGF